jgi:hypothetical protein
MVARAGLGMVPRREVTLVFAALGRTLQGEVGRRCSTIAGMRP